MIKKEVSKPKIRVFSKGGDERPEMSQFPKPDLPNPIHPYSREPGENSLKMKFHVCLLILMGKTIQELSRTGKQLRLAVEFSVHDNPHVL